MSTRPLPKRLRRFWTSKRLRDRLLVLALGAFASAYLLGVCSRTAGSSYLACLVAFVPWLLTLERAERRRDALFAGLVMSVFFVALVFPWFPETAASYAATSPSLVWPLFLLLAPVLEPQFVVFALVRLAVRRADRPYPALRAALAAAAAYVGVELVFPKLFFDTVGLGLHPAASLRQGAEIVGAHGLSFLLLLVNEGLALSIVRLVRAPKDRGFAHPALPAALVILAVLAGVGYGRARRAALAEANTRPAILVGVVQANITNYDKLRAEKGAFETVRTILDTHFKLSDAIRERKSLELLVWPETVYPTTFGAPKSEDGAAFDEEIGAFVAKTGVPLVFGSYESEGDDEYNAAFFLTNDGNGKVRRASYRKRMLFPFTEWVPPMLDSPSLRSLMPWAGHWKRGPGPAVVRVGSSGHDDVTALPLICYDVLFPGFVAEAAAKGADLIVTLSNDSWFPDGRAPRLHLVSAAFRSIETRLPQVRATNSGISAIVSADGEILARTRFDEEETLAAEVQLAARLVTPMMAFGHLRAPAFLALAALLLGHAWWFRAGRRNPRASRPERRTERRRPRATGPAAAP
ncbi:apolipoprotein N-acyltransferase [Polyangium jinanense]|uniref:Apolipoprotein N-acyltransferase n=1 Tax=Polyangium jinanense TaxID=2829994 RepID=A0A9X4AWS2_9BACT|nr:apolipoprotein N-acyltransferase [Polyangium jinanense]MDC3956999.1 apolipoprotein N-acyltransferase [Polyangium jinanense]MDC3987156.1 apolipoprotein N-acyltransferase [Polyangium jinanense]